MPNPSQEGKSSDKEAAKRQDAGLKALLKMPPKPHEQIAGKKKPTGKKPLAKQGDDS